MPTMWAKESSGWRSSGNSAGHEQGFASLKCKRRRTRIPSLALQACRDINSRCSRSSPRTKLSGNVDPVSGAAPRIDQQNPTHPQREISEPVIAAPGIQCAIIPAEMIAAPPAKSEAPAFQLRPLAAWHRSATIHAYGSYQAVPEEDAVSNGDASQPRSIP